MSAKVLVLTTGGSSEPLVTSILHHKPDYVIFLCSPDKKGPPKQPGSYNTVDGKGLSCKEWGKEPQPSIVHRSGLKKDLYEIILIPNIDSIYDCYSCSEQAFNLAREKFSRAEIIIDYTGGTKSMSAGLVSAALDDGNVELYIVGGVRPDLVKVRSGTQGIRKENWMPLLYNRKMKLLTKLFAQYDYDGCLELIEQLGTQLVVGSEIERVSQVYRSIALAFLAWDQFRHEEAMEELELYSAYFVQEKAYLIEVIKAKQSYINPEAHGNRLRFHLVHDLLRNAERRLWQKKYDDAVGRTYRALEMIAQFCLLYNKPSINSADVNIDILPERLKEKYRLMQRKMTVQSGRKDSNILTIGLFRAYELLLDLDHPIGKIFEERKQQIQDLIRLRNESIFAHGLSPIDSEKAWEFYHFTCKLIIDGEKLMKMKFTYENAPNFPIKIPEKIWIIE